VLEEDGLLPQMEVALPDSKHCKNVTIISSDSVRLADAVESFDYFAEIGGCLINLIQSWLLLHFYITPLIHFITCFRVSCGFAFYTDR
jgi:hypothetical protein